MLVGDELERVDLVRARRAGAQPGKDLLTSPAGDRAGDVLPGHVEVEPVGERVDVVAAQRVDPVEYELEVGFCLVVTHRYLQARKRTAALRKSRAGRRARPAAQPFGRQTQARAQRALEALLRGGGPRSRSGSLPSARHQNEWYAAAAAASKRRQATPGPRRCCLCARPSSIANGSVRLIAAAGARGLRRRG